jgi:hypothetical protein
MIPIKVGFVLLSNSQAPIPSTRIAVLNMFPFLRACNVDPHIVFDPLQATETPDLSCLAPRLVAEGFRIVVFQKVHGQSVEEAARQLREAGIKTVYCVCDLVDPRMAEATDATIVVTDYLRSLYPPALQPKVHVVHDGVERPEQYKTEWSPHAGSLIRPLRAVLVTSAPLDHLPVLGTSPAWLEVTIVGRYPPAGRMIERMRYARWKMAGKTNVRSRLEYAKFLANRRIRCVAWDPVGVYERMRRADIGIIPIETFSEHLPGMPSPAWKVKSENRLTMKMGVGLPVIATPIPSYETVIEQGKNGFLARSEQEWKEYLDLLRDPQLRRLIGEQARESVLKRYSMEEQAHRLLDVFVSLLTGSAGTSAQRDTDIARV